jgi:hypothetical protein
MFEFLAALFNAIAGVSKAVEKGMPNDKIQEAKFEVKKPTLEIHERIKRQNKIFNKIKNVPDADVRNFVLEFTDTNEEDTDIMVKNITVRIAEYRRDFPIISGWRRFTKNK